MKVTIANPGFRPVTIKLETVDELDAILEGLHLVRERQHITASRNVLAYGMLENIHKELSGAK